MRKFLTIALTAASVALAACGGGGDDPIGPANIAGTYTLRTVNNAELPFTTDEDENYKAEILSSAITLNSNNTFSWAFTGRSTDNGTPTINAETFTGTYTVTGSSIRMTDSEGYTDATVGNGTITMVIDGPVGTFTLLFRR